MFSGEDALEAMAEVRGYLKAVKQIADREVSEPGVEQEAALVGLRGLVGIAREVAKGPDGNPVVVDNVDLLKAKYVDMFAGTALTPPSSPISSTNRPSDVVPAPVPLAPRVHPAGLAPMPSWPRPLDETGRPIPD